MSEQVCENRPECRYQVASIAPGYRHPDKCPLCGGSLVLASAAEFDTPDTDTDTDTDGDDDATPDFDPTSRPERSVPPGEIPSLGESVTVATSE